MKRLWWWIVAVLLVGGLTLVLLFKFKREPLGITTLGRTNLSGQTYVMVEVLNRSRHEFMIHGQSEQLIGQQFVTITPAVVDRTVLGNHSPAPWRNVLSGRSKWHIELPAPAEKTKWRIRIDAHREATRSEALLWRWSGRRGLFSPKTHFKGFLELNE